MPFEVARGASRGHLVVRSMLKHRISVSYSIQAAALLRSGQPYEAHASVSREHEFIHCTTRAESFRATKPPGNEWKSLLSPGLAVKSTRTAFLFAFFEAFGVFHGTIFGIKTIRLSSGEIFIANKTTGNWPSMRLRLL